jgi:uncharacterized protein
MSYSKEELVQYRMLRPRESLKDAEILVKEERWSSAANRMYYACFYAVSAYLAFRGLKATTHSGLKSAFNQELVKTGKIVKSEGVLFNKLFSLRQEADYEDFTEIKADEITPMLPEVERLIFEIDELIKKEDDR